MTFEELLIKIEKTDNNNMISLIKKTIKNDGECPLSENEIYYNLRGLVDGLYTLGFLTHDDRFDLYDDLFKTYID